MGRLGTSGKVTRMAVILERQFHHRSILIRVFSDEHAPSNRWCWFRLVLPPSATSRLDDRFYGGNSTSIPGASSAAKGAVDKLIERELPDGHLMVSPQKVALPASR